MVYKEKSLKLPHFMLSIFFYFWISCGIPGYSNALSGKKRGSLQRKQTEQTIETQRKHTKVHYKP